MSDQTETTPTIEEMRAAIPLSVKVRVWFQFIAPFMIVGVSVILGILTYIHAPDFGLESVRNHGVALIVAPLYVLGALYVHMRVSNGIIEKGVAVIPQSRLRIRAWTVSNHIAWVCLNSVLLGLLVLGTSGYLDELHTKILLGGGLLSYLFVYGFGAYAIGVGRNLLEDDVGFVLQLQEWAKEANVKPA